MTHAEPYTDAQIREFKAVRGAAFEMLGTVLTDGQADSLGHRMLIEWTPGMTPAELVRRCQP